MSTTPPARLDDPYPHAAYLAVTADGEVIGVARGHPGSTLVLQFFGDRPSSPTQLTLRPHNVPEGRRAPALVCHTAQGLPALARQKRGGHYVVTCTLPCPDQLCLDAVYEAWIWKRLQAMAERQSAGARATARPPANPTLSPAAAGVPVMPLLPFPLAPFTPHRRPRPLRPSPR